MRTILRILALAVVLASSPAFGAEIKVMISGGLSSPYNELVPLFERETGHKVTTVSGASMRPSPNALPNRVDRCDPVDVVFVVGAALGDLVNNAKVLPRSPV